ncbi:MAG: phosphatase PAP2 family protein [Acidobacteriota bacterium]
MAFSWMGRWSSTDWVVALYTSATALLIVTCYPAIPGPGAGWLLAFHGGVLGLLFLLPPRGAAWEQPRPGEPGWRRVPKEVGRFLRYTYPALLILPFFEEVQYTVNAVAPKTPYWFEPYLYAADRWIFGDIPSVLLSPWVGPPVSEIVHGFYFSYYLILICGVVLAWVGPGTGELGRRTPGPGFETAMTAMMLGFFLSFLWYPWLPARGPWENVALMARLPRFEGTFFTPLVEWIIERGSVSGGCFPSSHVSGSWGLVLGLVPTHRRAGLGLSLLVAAMSLSCIYTRYHHAVDVPAGLLAGVVGAALGRALTRRPRGPLGPQH